MNHTLGNYGTETPGFEVVFTVLFSGKQSLVEFYLANLQCGKQSRMQIGPFQKIKVTKLLFQASKWLCSEMHIIGCPELLDKCSDLRMIQPSMCYISSVVILVMIGSLSLVLLIK